MLIRLVFLAAFGLGAVAPAAADAQGRTRRAAPAASPRAQFENGMMRSEAGPLFLAMRRNFPAETRALIDRFYAIASANRTNMTAYQRGLLREQAAFLQSLLPHLRRAPEADLLLAVRARVALFEAMQRADPALCGQVAAQGSALRPLGEEIKQRNSDAMVAIIDAAGAGRRAPGPLIADLTPEDVSTIGAAFGRLDPTGDLRPILIGEVEPTAVAPERICRFALATQRLVLALPPGTAGRAAFGVLEETFTTGMPAI